MYIEGDMKVHITSMGAQVDLMRKDQGMNVMIRNVERRGEERKMMDNNKISSI